jgi:O-antigen/teichoic acid export membrane protein
MIDNDWKRGGSRRMTSIGGINRLIKRQRPGRLVRNAIALMVSSGGTSVIGVIFWGVAAHLAPASTIGANSAEIVAMTLLANLAQLSFGSIFERFLPVAGDRTRSFVKRAYSMCVPFALILGTVYVLLGFSHSFLPRGIGWKILFIASVALWTIFVLQDSVLIGLRASRWVPVENILFALAKLLLLPLLIAATVDQGVFVAWIAPVIPVIAVMSWYLFQKRIPEHEAANAANESLPTNHELILLAGAQYATLLLNVFSPSIVTLIVIGRLGSVANAHYYVPSLVTSGLAVLMYSISRSFLVEASHEPFALRRHADSAIRAMALLLTAFIVIGEIFAPQFLRIFGSSYEQNGTTLLRMLLLSLPLSAVSIFYSAFAWIDRRVWWMTVRDLISAAIYFGVIIALIGHEGINAIGIAALVSSGLQGILFLPISIRRYRQTTNYAPPGEIITPPGAQ